MAKRCERRGEPRGRLALTSVVVFSTAQILMACNGEAANRPPVDGSANAPDGMTVRDPMQQPFAATSIWNMPIGSNARFVAANIVPPTERTLDHDDEIIVLTPSAPLVDIHKNTADWDPTNRAIRRRCRGPSTGRVVGRICRGP